jgi:hypothetical protein
MAQAEALKMGRGSGAVLPLLWALPTTALLPAGQGENARAVELYVAKSGRFTSLN